MEDYINKLGKGGSLDGYIGDIGKGGNVDDFLGYLEGRGIGKIGDYLMTIKGANGTILEYIQKLGGTGNYDDVLKILRSNGWDGKFEDYKEYVRDYEKKIKNLGDIKDYKKLVQKRIDYDYTCEAKHLEDCLLNSIYLTGPNVVLVNLDNSCQVDKVEREGIFLQTGDLLFVTGREHTCAW